MLSKGKVSEHPENLKSPFTAAQLSRLIEYYTKFQRGEISFQDFLFTFVLVQLAGDAEPTAEQTAIARLVTRSMPKQCFTDPRLADEEADLFFRKMLGNVLSDLATLTPDVATLRRAVDSLAANDDAWRSIEAL